MDGAVGSESRSDPGTSCAGNAQSQETSQRAVKASV